MSSRASFLLLVNLVTVTCFLTGLWNGSQVRFATSPQVLNSGPNRDIHFFGENGRPEGYRVPFHKIAPETLFFCGGRNELRSQGYRPTDPISKRANLNNIFVDKNRIIQPRGLEEVGTNGLLFEGLRQHVWDMFEMQNALTILPAGTPIPDGLILSQPFPRWLPRYSLEPSIPLTVRAFNKKLKEFGERLEESSDYDKLYKKYPA